MTGATYGRKAPLYISLNIFSFGLGFLPLSLPFPCVISPPYDVSDVTSERDPRISRQHDQVVVHVCTD